MSQEWLFHHSHEVLTGITRDDSGLLFLGADRLNYSVLEENGLKPEERPDRGRISTFYIDAQGKPVVKRLYDGFAIVLTGDVNVTRTLALTGAKRGKTGG